MDNLLIPTSIDGLKKIMSQDIVETFLKSQLPAAEINTDVTGRPAFSVYASLKIYLRNHPEHRVSAKIVGGKLMLIKDETPDEHPESE